VITDHYSHRTHAAILRDQGPPKTTENRSATARANVRDHGFSMITDSLGPQLALAGGS